MAATARGMQWQPDMKLCQALLSQAERAMETFRKAGNLEGETRATASVLTLSRVRKA